MSAILQQPILVLGAGSFGTALSVLLARNGNHTRLWSHEQSQADSLSNERVNQQFLPDIALPDNLHCSANLKECLQGCQDIVVAVPSHAFREVVQKVHELTTQPLRVAWGTKGLDPQHCQLMHEVVWDVMSPDNPVAAISGPSFAREIAMNCPTAVSLAGNDDDFTHDLITRLHNDRFRVYKNSDLIGVQLCGALKNVLAIAVGVVDGLKLGANARCALITRGLAEMGRLCVACGGKQQTLMSLAGVGDLILTCTDDQSRNRRFGLAVGSGQSAEQALAEIGQAVEGLQNIKQVYELAQRLKIEMPIVTQAYQVLFAKASPVEVMHELLTRSPKQEG